jgi:general secretion pathway protein A
MYDAFFGLKERPFDLTPDPRFLMMTPRHEEALSTVEYGIAGGKGIALVVGSAGTGKTTLVQAALDRQTGGNALGVCLSNPTLKRREFYEFLAVGFGLSAAAAESKARFLIELRELLESRQQRGDATALIIDEAQSLPDKLMQEVRLLANIESATAKLLAVVLVGQAELGQRLNAPHMQQLKQRVALRSVLTPLNLTETAAYIANRIRVAGGDAREIFTKEAIAEIFQRSGGIPRTINVVCDNALVAAFALDQQRVTRTHIVEVCRDLDFGPASAAASASGSGTRSSPVPGAASPSVGAAAPAKPPAVPIAASPGKPSPPPHPPGPAAEAQLTAAAAGPAAPAAGTKGDRVRGLLGLDRRARPISLFEFRR